MTVQCSCSANKLKYSDYLKSLNTQVVYLSIQQIANNFVTERNRNEVIGVG